MRSAEPYASPQRVFWGVDNATIHRGEQAATRLRTWPNLVLVYLPRHASWPNQIEIYFSILARKALTPRTSTTSTNSLRVLGFQHEFATSAQPFHWTFTRQHLHALLDRLDQRRRLAPAP